LQTLFTPFDRPGINSVVKKKQRVNIRNVPPGGGVCYVEGV